MPAAYYTPMSRHALRYRCKYPDGPKRDVDTWNAADAALNALGDRDREAMVSIYTAEATLPDAILRVAKDNGVAENHLWSVVNRIEKTVARTMGWIIA